MENKILKKYSELLKEAMKAQNVVQREMYKLIKARLQNYMTQPGSPELTESVEIQILNKILKELIDERYNNAKLNKEDRVKELNEQIEVVHKLLPKPATAEEITAAIDEYIKANGSITQKDMGTMMSYLGGKFTNLDRKLANTLIRAKF